MTTTTKDMNVADALIAIGTWLKEGRVIEYRNYSSGSTRWAVSCVATTGTTADFRNYEYRPRPKPRTFIHIIVPGSCNGVFQEVRVVERTPEVEASLKRDGLL